MEIRNGFKDVGFPVDTETGQGDLSTPVGLNIPKYTVSLMPSDDHGDNDKGWKATTPDVCSPSGHLGFKTTKLCVLIYEKETDTPGLFNSTHILINHLHDMQNCKTYSQDLFSKKIPAQTHFGVTKQHSVGFLYAEFLETLFSGYSFPQNFLSL